LAEDAELIRAQAERCREILRELAASGKDDRQVKTAPVQSLAEEAAAPHSGRGKRVVLRLQGRVPDETGPEQPEVRRLPEVIHGLRNMVQNAVDFAASTVWVDVEWDEAQLRIAIGDDGPGFGEDMLGRLGDPYVRNRVRRPPSAETPEGPPPEARAGYEGMGLGLFIAKTLLERTGARVSFANGADEEGRGAASRGTAPEGARPPGAIVEVVWPRGTLDLPQGRPRGALGRNAPFSLDNV
jgi:two-component system sensor histidine kinase RegB